MGVDNYGILFLGLEVTEVDITSLPGYDSGFIEENGIDEFLYKMNTEDKLTSQADSCDYSSVELIGYELANSGPYDYKEVNGLTGTIATKTKQFLRRFGVEPKIYIMNYQC
jgi:hypothetical protein